MAVLVHRVGGRPDGPLSRVVVPALPVGATLRVTAADHRNVGVEIERADGTYAEVLLRASELEDLLLALAELARGYGHDVHVGALARSPQPQDDPPAAEAAQDGPQGAPGSP